MRSYESPTISLLAQHLTVFGSRVSPRGLKTYELLGVTTRWPLGEYPTRVGMSARLAATEAWMLVAGTFDVELVRRAAPNARLDLFTHMARYGPMVRSQLPKLVGLLRREPDTRRAVLYFGRPAIGLSDKSPCTNSIQFLIREGKLHAFVSMRSWDLVYGVPNDVVMFTALGLSVAKTIPVLPGTLQVTAGSLHVYDETAHLAKSAAPERGAVTVSFEKAEYESWQEVVQEALRYEQEPWEWVRVLRAREEVGDDVVGRRDS